MAGLGYCRRLHIYGCRFGEMTYYLAHLFAGINKPVAGDYQSGMHSRGYRLGYFYNVGWRLIACRHALHLAIYCLADGFAAIYVVICQFGAHHHIHYLNICATASGTTR